MNYTQHKLSAAFPAMSHGEYEELKASMRELYAWLENGSRPDEIITGNELPLTSAQMAASAGVSEQTIVNAKAAIKAGFTGMLESREIGAKPAAELARKAPEVAARVVAKEITPAEGKAQLQAKVKRELPTVPGPDLNAELTRMQDQMFDMQAEIIALKAASFDPGKLAESKDEIQGIRDALALECRLHSALKAQVSTQEYQLNDWKKRCASLEKELARRERGE